MIPLVADLATLTQADRDIQNFFSMVAQYSFHLSEAGKVEEALSFTDLVLDTYGKRDSIVKVRDVIAYNDVLAFLENQDYGEVEQRLAHYRSSSILHGDSYKKTGTQVQEQTTRRACEFF